MPDPSEMWQQDYTLPGACLQNSRAVELQACVAFVWHVNSEPPWGPYRFSCCVATARAPDGLRKHWNKKTLVTYLRWPGGSPEPSPLRLPWLLPHSEPFSLWGFGKRTKGRLEQGTALRILTECWGERGWAPPLGEEFGSVHEET